MAKRLLLVNDSVAIREVVELTFENSDIHTRTAVALEEALEAMRQESADIIVADADKTELGVWDLCREVKQDPALSSIPLILLTGDEEESSRPADITPDLILPKPFGSDDLEHAVASLVGRESEEEPVSDEEEVRFKMENETNGTPDIGMEDEKPLAPVDLDMMHEPLEAEEVAFDSNEDKLEMIPSEESTPSSVETAPPADPANFSEENFSPEAEDVPSFPSTEENVAPPGEVASAAPPLDIPAEDLRSAIESAVRQAVLESLQNLESGALENLIASSVRETIQKVAPDLTGVVERVAREIVPDLAEIWIQREIQRLKEED